MVRKKIRKDLLIRKTRTLLGEFLHPMLREVDRPRKRFLPQVIRGILFSGSLTMMDIARWVRDDCSDLFHRDKRLLNHLVGPEGDLTAAVGRYRQAASGHVSPDTALILDLTDLPKPRAKKMQYPDLVRDDSEGKLVQGYWCIEVYAHLKGKRILPLAMEAYGIPDPAVVSENVQIQRVVTAVHHDLGGNGIWVADRFYGSYADLAQLQARGCDGGVPPAGFPGLLAWIAHDRLPQRPERIKPRAIKRRPKPYSRLTRPRKEMRKVLSR
jgi:hypothetical protein